MHQNRIWFFFIAIIGLLTASYLLMCAIQVFHYYRLNESTAPEQIMWSAKKIKEEAFVPHAEYLFSHKGKSYQGSYLFSYEKYRNVQSLEKKLPEYQEQKFRVWYDSENPVVSSLEKIFPLKESVSAAILAGLFIYFLGLGIYVGNRQG